MVLLAGLSQVAAASSPQAGVTTFGTGAGDLPLATGPGSKGVSVRDVARTGWDVHVETSTDNDISIVVGERAGLFDAAVYYIGTKGQGEPMASFTLSSSDGSRFALRGFHASAQHPDGPGKIGFVVTGLRAGVPVDGATEFFTVKTDTSVDSVVFVDTSAFKGFSFIDAFSITVAGEAASLFAIDDVTIDDVVPPNAAPRVMGLGDGVVFLEGSAPVLLDPMSDAVVTDADSPDLSGGRVVVSIVSGRVASEDVLAVTHQGTGPGQVGRAGSSVLFGGAPIGSVSGGTGTAALVVQLSGVAATPSAVSALLRAVTYLNTNTLQPAALERTVRVTIDDGDGGTSTPVDVRVTVVDVNDPPQLSAVPSQANVAPGGAAADLFRDVAVSTGESGQTLTGLWMTVTGVRDGGDELVGWDGAVVPLRHGAAGAAGAATYAVTVAGTSASVALTMDATPAGMAQRVDALTYRHLSATATSGTRTITIAAIRDSGGTSHGGDDTTALGITATVEVLPVPRVTMVTATTGDGAYREAASIAISVVFDEPVVVDTTGGLPTLRLETGGVDRDAVYVGGSGQRALSFLYTVGTGDMSADLDYTSAEALVLNGATLRSLQGVDASRTLPAPAGPLSLAGQHDIRVDTQPPTIVVGGPSVAETTRGPVSFIVSYTDADFITLDAPAVTLDAAGTATGHLSIGGTGSTRIVTVADISGSGRLSIRVAAGTAEDLAGNKAPAAGSGASVAVYARDVTQVSPTSGVATGGVVVTLTGDGLTRVAEPMVHFGGTPAMRVEVIDATRIEVVTPPLPAGAPVDVTLFDGGIVVATRLGGYTPLDPPAEPTRDTDGDGLPDAWELRYGLDPLDPTDALLDSDFDGVSNLAAFAAGAHPRGLWRRGLAEGVVSETFTTVVSLFNPEPTRASVVMRVLGGQGTAAQTVIDLEPGQAVSRNLSDVADLPPGAYALAFETDVPVVVSGLTSWAGTAHGGGAETAVELSATWMLAEGATHGPFDLFYLLANPQGEAVDVDVTFLRPAPEPPLARRYRLEAHSRTTVWVDLVDPLLASTDVGAVIRTVNGTPIVVERAMYAHDGSGRWGVAGHRSSGVVAAATTWHLAEGYIGAPFDTYLLFANPQPTAAEIMVDVADATGVVHTQRHIVEAGSRLTVDAGDMPVPAGPVSFTVRVVNDQPIVVERAMWWRDVAGGAWVESHASPAASAGARRWGLAAHQVEGRPPDAFYLLVQNLEDVAAVVDVSVTLGDGRVATRSYVAAGHARLTVDLRGDFADLSELASGVVVASSGEVVVEASRYWHAEGVRWSVGTTQQATSFPSTAPR